MINIAASAPMAPAKFVVIKISATLKALSPEIASCDPGLNPNHPNHKMKTPSAPKTKLCPGIAFDFPSVYFLSYF